MNKLEMTLAIEQMLKEISESRQQDLSIKTNKTKGTIDLTWTVQGKKKSYSIKVEAK